MKKLQILLIIFLISSTAFAQKPTTYLFIGTYTDAKPDTGIFVYSLNSKTGKLKRISFVENITNPSYLAVTPNGKYLYACTDTKMPNAGSITSFEIDSIKGGISLINKQPGGGENPVYLSIHRNNKSIVMAKYTAGNVSVFNTNSNGSINPMIQNIDFTGNSINQQRQEKPHIHCAVFSPDYDYLFCTDLGSDKIRAFKFDAESEQPLVQIDSLTINTIPGSGPRHMVFHPNKKYFYCIEELSCMVSAYTYSNGKLCSIQRINSASAKGSDGADIHISPDGLFLYTTNRGENTISIFTIAKDGKLNILGHESTLGEMPRNFTIDPSGKFLIVANQKTSNVLVFKRNSKTGMLKFTGFEVSVPQPSCLKMIAYRK